MQLCSMKQGTVSPCNTAPRCLRVLQVFPTMLDSSEFERRERTASCSQDEVEGGFGSDAPRSKFASPGLTLRRYRKNTTKYNVLSTANHLAAFYQF